MQAVLPIASWRQAWCISLCDGFTGRRRSTTCAHVEVFSEKKSIEVYHFRAQEDGRTPTALCRAAMLLEMTCSPRAGRESRRKAPSFGGIWHHLAPVERLSGGCDRCHHGAKRSGAQDFEASEAPATSALDAMQPTWRLRPPRPPLAATRGSRCSSRVLLSLALPAVQAGRRPLFMEASLGHALAMMSLS